MDREATELRRIAGIGTAMERKLREAGIRTLADLAGRPADELVGIAGKPAQTVQEWQARARELAAGEVPQPTEADRQRSETFTVEVLLNEDGTVRYVRAEHVYTQAGHAQDDRAETASWRDWQSAAQGLAGFLGEHTGLSAGEPEARQAQLQAPAEPAAPPGAAAAESVPTGHRVRRLAAMPSPSGSGGELQPSANMPFTLRLPVELAQLGLAPVGTLAYQATVVAKRLGQPWRQVVAEATGTVLTAPDGRFDVLVRCEGLPAGTYRLEAALRLQSGDQEVVALLENAVIELLPEQASHPDRPTLVPFNRP
jgi:hypothetical protein